MGVDTDRLWVGKIFGIILIELKMELARLIPFKENASISSSLEKISLDSGLPNLKGPENLQMPAKNHALYKSGLETSSHAYALKFWLF